MEGGRGEGITRAQSWAVGSMAEAAPAGVGWHLGRDLASSGNADLKQKEREEGRERP